MAKQTTVTLVDDLDGGDAEEQVQFSVDGRSYEIDLSSANSARLRELLAPYVAAARRTGGRRGSGGSAGPDAPSARSSGDRQRNQEIRRWAAEQGREISERGRIPSDVIEAYDQAH